MRSREFLRLDLGVGDPPRSTCGRSRATTRTVVDRGYGWAPLALIGAPLARNRAEAAFDYDNNNGGNNNNDEHHDDEHREEENDEGLRLKRKQQPESTRAMTAAAGNSNETDNKVANQGHP